MVFGNRCYHLIQQVKRIMGSCVNKPFRRARWQQQTITESDIIQTQTNKRISFQEVKKGISKTFYQNLDADNANNKQNKLFQTKNETRILKLNEKEEFLGKKAVSKFQINNTSNKNHCQQSAPLGKMELMINEDFERQGIVGSLISWLTQSQITPFEVESDPRGLMEIISNLSIDLISREPNQSKLITKSNAYQQQIRKVTFVQQHPAKYYYFKEQIGSGGACVVFKAYQKRHQQNLDDSNFSQITMAIPYAVRVFKINDISSIERMRHEIAVMNVCSSPNIMKYYFSYFFKDSLFMFTEYMNGGSLTKFIKYQRQIKDDLIAYIVKQILLGLKVIHKNGQIHRDIKSDNILMNDQGNIKIGDFGHALQISKSLICKDTQIVGTPAWMAPELIKKESYTQAVDIWSLGIVITQLCQGEPAYLRLNQYKAMYMIVSRPPPEINGHSKALSSFASQCLQKNAQARSTVEQLLLHPFIVGIGNGIAQKSKLASIIKNSLKKNGNRK